jgi:hypothetical protein
VCWVGWDFGKLVHTRRSLGRVNPKASGTVQGLQQALRRRALPWAHTIPYHEYRFFKRRDVTCQTSCGVISRWHNKESGKGEISGTTYASQPPSPGWRFRSLRKWNEFAICLGNPYYSQLYSSSVIDIQCASTSASGSELGEFPTARAQRRKYLPVQVWIGHVFKIEFLAQRIYILFHSPNSKHSLRSLPQWKSKTHTQCTSKAFKMPSASLWGCYELLGLTNGCTELEIKSAYKRLASCTTQTRTEEARDQKRGSN